jgi:hypothetical protein
MTTEQHAITTAPRSRGSTITGAVAFRPRTMRIRRRLQLPLAALALATLAGCNCSPRQEYLQTRAVEISPSSSGDGTLLANRDKIMTGDKGPSAPLASVESQPDKQ